LIVCAALGELSEKNPNSWVKRNDSDENKTTNVHVQVVMTDDDRALWDDMDKAM
jgi:hypothetical protein